MIVGESAHIFSSEQGGAAALGGIPLYPVPDSIRRHAAVQDIRGAIRSDDIHNARTRLICIENTHMPHANGAPLTPEYTDQVRELADAHHLHVHTDGARIFNAAIALGVDVQECIRDSDTVQFCLSKGLAAPVGSILAGPTNLSTRRAARRKMVGGGTRQAGVLAAAGILRWKRW